MSFFNKVWRVGVLGIVAVALATAACADDDGAAFGPPGPPEVVTGSISGRVVSSATGNPPVAGALVGTNPATSTAITDANGNYRIENIPIPATGSASFAVTATHPNFTTGAAATQTVTLTAQAPNATANLTLTAAAPPQVITTGNLQVLVTDRNGVPQSGASVVARRAGATDSLTATTDASGFVVFNNVPAGAYTVRASRTISGVPFRASGGVNVVAGQTAFLQLSLGRDFGQTVFPNFRGDATTAVDIDIVSVPGARDANPDIDCNVIRTQHMFIARVVNAAGQRVSGVKVEWTLNTSENGTISTRCPELTDDPAGCTIPTVPGNTGSIVDTDDPDLDPFRARSGLDPAFRVDARAAITFTNDQTGPGNTVSFNNQSVTVGEGETWIVITSPVEGVTDVIAATPDIAAAADCGLSDAPATRCDKDFAIKRWVNWDVRVFELVWPNEPGPTRDPHDDPAAVFTPVTNNSTFTNVLRRGFGAVCPGTPGGRCDLREEFLFISEVRRLRPDSPFNISRGTMVWDVTDDVPDVDFFGEDPGNSTDGCDVGVCNAEHNGPSDDRYTVSLPTRNSATIEFDANNNVFDGGVFTQNPDCTAPCDEDDFIGWGIVEVRLDPTVFFCIDTDGDGDCNPAEPGGDVFSPGTAGLLAGNVDNTSAFRVRFVDEFGEVCAEFNFRKRFVTSRLQVIKNFPGATRRLVEGFNVKTHTVLVGETFSYTITAINEGEVRAQNVRITDTLPRFGDQFSGPPDLGAPAERNGGMAFTYVTDRPAFDPQAIVYGVDEDNDAAGAAVDFCIVGRQAGNANAAAFVPPPQCTTVTEAGSVEAARALAQANAAEASSDQIVFIQYYDELILARTAVGGGVESEDSVEITLRATPSLYTAGLTPPATRVPGTWCNIATVTDGPLNRGNRGTTPPTQPIAQSFDADTLCHEVREALLDIRKTAIDAVITAGDSARFRVEVANLGSANLTNVVIRDTLDVGLLFAGPPPRRVGSGDVRINAANCPGCTVVINADSITFTLTIPTLTPGGFREVFTLVVPATTTPGTFCNRVTARASRPSGELVETDIACITVLPGAVEFDVSNEDGFRDAAGVFQSAKEVFRVGDGSAARPNELIYQVIITNRSATFTATNVVVRDFVAPNSGIIEFREVIAGFPTRGTVSGTSNAGFTWNIGTLGPGQSAEIQFRAEALRPGDDVNRVELTADQISGSRRDEEPTTVVP